jgi:hypothetical protein
MTSKNHPTKHANNFAGGNGLQYFSMEPYPSSDKENEIKQDDELSLDNSSQGRCGDKT